MELGTMFLPMATILLAIQACTTDSGNQIPTHLLQTEAAIVMKVSAMDSGKDIEIPNDREWTLSQLTVFACDETPYS
jgi:hypothetical protein